MSLEQSASFDLNELHRAACSGDREAENRLMGYLTVSFRLFAQHRIWHVEDAEEVVQEALVTVLAKYKGLEIETSFAGWAYRVLQNKILDFVKKKSARRRLDEANADDLTAETYVCPDPQLRARLIECFRKINRTNSRHARVLNLHYQGYPVTEVCRRLGVTENNLYVLLSRARRALELCLKKGGTAHE
jgi:RNA polymerase sigma-70 factor (ECF subfamily)